MKAVALTILLFTSVFSFAQTDADTVALRRSASVEPLPSDAIKAFPNPATSYIYITVKMTGLAVKTIFLYDKDGNRVVEQRVNSVLSAPVKVSLTNLPEGKYYAVIETNKQPFRFILLKQ